MSFPLDSCLNYDVSLWYSWHDTYVYAGYGKYFKTAEEAEQYAKDNAEAKKAMEETSEIQEIKAEEEE